MQARWEKQMYCGLKLCEKIFTQTTVHIPDWNKLNCAHWGKLFLCLQHSALIDFKLNITAMFRFVYHAGIYRIFYENRVLQIYKIWCWIWKGMRFFKYSLLALHDQLCIIKQSISIKKKKNKTSPA